MTMKTLDGLIECDPARRGGTPLIAGTGITVATIAGLREEGLSAEDIVREVFPHLTLAQVYAGFAAYELNRDAVDAYVREEGELYDRLSDEQAHRPGA